MSWLVLQPVMVPNQDLRYHYEMAVLKNQVFIITIYDIMYFIFITMLQSALNKHESHDSHLMACLMAETVK